MPQSCVQGNRGAEDIISKSEGLWGFGKRYLLFYQVAISCEEKASAYRQDWLRFGNMTC